MAAPRIALFVDRPDWHSRRLKQAFAARDMEAVPVALPACGFHIDVSGLGGEHRHLKLSPPRKRGPTASDGDVALDSRLRGNDNGGDGYVAKPGIAIPGFDEPPAAAFVRQISAGSFEQVTLRLGLLHALRDTGVPVCNDARAIERCVDKSMTSFLLRQAGLPTPATWVTESRDRALAVVRAEARPDRPLVLKPLFGSQGRGLRLVARADELPSADEAGGVYYLQHFVHSAGAAWRDWRVFIVGARAVAAMIRHGMEWRTNAAQGARCEGVAVDAALGGLAVAAARAVGADYAGVDIIAGEDGSPLVLEVNSMPAWQALQGVAQIDIAACLAAHMAARL